MKTWAKVRSWEAPPEVVGIEEAFQEVDESVMTYVVVLEFEILVVGC